MVLHALIHFFPILNTRSSPDLGMFNFEIVRQNHSFILPQKVVGQSRAKIGWLETVKKLGTCVKSSHKKITR